MLLIRESLCLWCQRETAALTRLYPLHNNRPVAVVNDPYFWMRSDSRDDPEVLAYIESENRATRHAMKHTEELQKVR